MKHDYCYDDPSTSKNECDKEMLEDLNTSKTNSLSEKVAKNLVVKPLIAAKYKLGLEKNEKRR